MGDGTDGDAVPVMTAGREPCGITTAEFDSTSEVQQFGPSLHRVPKTNQIIETL
jgi:hypothetical protein